MSLNIIILLTLSALIPYLISSFNSAIIVIRLKNGKDIRNEGSGNAGLTNTLRVGGKGAAALVLLGDMCKGIFSVFIVRGLFSFFTENFGVTDFHHIAEWLPFYAGFFACLGHNFPIYYGFKGGKGALITAAVLFAINPLSAGFLVGVFLIVSAITRYVSVGSITSAILYPIWIYIYEVLICKESDKIYNWAFASVISLLIVFMHRSNIRRLMNHTENKLGSKKKS